MIKYEEDALEYIAKIADGGMRDAITLMDKCLAFSKDLTLENVVKALGVVDYAVMCALLENTVDGDVEAVLKIISDVYYAGKDLKLFIKQFTSFVLDVLKFKITDSIEYTQIPRMYKDRIDSFMDLVQNHLLSTLVKLNSEIKWETSPKALVEATLLLEVSNDWSK